jgi:hypothetical protein
MVFESRALGCRRAGSENVCSWGKTRNIFYAWSVLSPATPAVGLFGIFHTFQTGRFLIFSSPWPV